jgi:hypothetical protein
MLVNLPYAMTCQNLVSNHCLVENTIIQVIFENMLFSGLGSYI